ncbi:hypothetical protein RA955_07245 [Geobacillus proteiniphilus]|uniref:Prolipoprotein diacylglyceryl transferase n=1 Tax=Geobacillus proteiniphilus TaxID=860353 RepID=A0ABY9MM46_9BACL|nr:MULTISPECIES: hypothetical protein [Geobacillus]MED4972150.1 hypothetical protein [Geobacillus thermoleovorans]OPX00431.1 hypothetical protein B1A75_18030 [Geobacillus sp. LEMMY01]QCK82239.1 hypothetical protein E5Z46_08260 [Geobacillus kaustophilus NBRC 102445]WMJ17818.1 hypothetical protein RA955_07245 [Geobacillus proteiniphilus]
MNDVIAVGPFLIRTGWLIWLAAGAGGYLFWRVVWTGSDEQFRHIRQLLVDGVLIYWLVWKIYPLFTNPSLLWRNPLGVLYLPSGNRGVMLGVATAAIVTMFRAYRRNIPMHLLVNSVIVIYLGAHFVYYLFERRYGSALNHGWFAFHPIHLYQLFLAAAVMLWTVWLRNPLERVKYAYLFLTIWGIGQWMIWLVAK